jgi:hypothetical protein
MRPPEPASTIDPVAAIPERARTELTTRLGAHQRRRWPQLKATTVRFRSPFAYIDATMPDGYDQPLFRLRWVNNRDRWAFAIWLASKDRYEISVLPSGAFVGTIEEAMDCVCGLYLNDISAWRLPGERSQSPH